MGKITSGIFKKYSTVLIIYALAVVHVQGELYNFFFLWGVVNTFRNTCSQKLYFFNMA